MPPSHSFTRTHRLSLVCFRYPLLKINHIITKHTYAFDFTFDFAFVYADAQAYTDAHAQAHARAHLFIS